MDFATFETYFIIAIVVLVLIVVIGVVWGILDKVNKTMDYVKEIRDILKEKQQ